MDGECGNSLEKAFAQVDPASLTSEDFYTYIDFKRARLDVLAKGQLLHTLDLEPEGNESEILLQGSHCRPVGLQHFNRVSHSIIAQLKVSMLAAQHNLCRQVLTRLYEIDAPMSKETYRVLESKLMYGGSYQLTFLADESINLLERLHRIWEDEESYEEACENLESSYGFTIEQLIGVFASEIFLIFVSRDRRDRLIYAYDTTEWRLFVLGEGWEEALKMFEEILSDGDGRAYIIATKENRAKYIAGWRPPPDANGLVYK